MYEFGLVLFFSPPFLQWSNEHLWSKRLWCASSTRWPKARWEQHLLQLSEDATTSWLKMKPSWSGNGLSMNSLKKGRKFKSPKWYFITIFKLLNFSRLCWTWKMHCVSCKSHTTTAAEQCALSSRATPEGSCSSSTLAHCKTSPVLQAAQGKHGTCQGENHQRIQNIPLLRVNGSLLAHPEFYPSWKDQSPLRKRNYQGGIIPFTEQRLMG